MKCDLGLFARCLDSVGACRADYRHECGVLSFEVAFWPLSLPSSGPPSGPRLRILRLERAGVNIELLQGEPRSILTAIH